MTSARVGSNFSTVAFGFIAGDDHVNGVVRVIEYELEGVSGAEPFYRLITTILDPDIAPGAELAALYHERWEIETALDELKTHLIPVSR